MEVQSAGDLVMEMNSAAEVLLEEIKPVVKVECKVEYVDGVIIVEDDQLVANIPIPVKTEHHNFDVDVIQLISIKKEVNREVKEEVVQFISKTTNAVKPEKNVFAAEYTAALVAPSASESVTSSDNANLYDSEQYNEYGGHNRNGGYDRYSNYGHNRYDESEEEEDRHYEYTAPARATRAPKAKAKPRAKVAKKAAKKAAPKKAKVEKKVASALKVKAEIVKQESVKRESFVKAESHMSARVKSESVKFEKVKMEIKREVKQEKV